MISRLKRSTSGDYDWEADVVEKHVAKKAEAKQLFREGAVGETAASDSSEDELFPELFKEKPEGTQLPSQSLSAQEAASGAAGSREGAAPSAPSTKQQPPLPPPTVPTSKAEELRAEATSERHLRTHFPKNPFCKICHIAKNTSMRVARKPDAKADDMIDAPTAPFQQLATDDVIMAKGDEHRGIGTGGVKSHHVVRDVFSGARVAYPMTRRGAAQHSRNFRHFMGLKANELSPACLIKRPRYQTGGRTMPCWKRHSGGEGMLAVQFICKADCRTICTPIPIHMHVSPYLLIGLLHMGELRSGRPSQRSPSMGKGPASGNSFGIALKVLSLLLNPTCHQACS